MAGVDAPAEEDSPTAAAIAVEFAEGVVPGEMDCGDADILYKEDVMVWMASLAKRPLALSGVNTTAPRCGAQITPFSTWHRTSLGRIGTERYSRSPEARTKDGMVLLLQKTDSN